MVDAASQAKAGGQQENRAEAMELNATDGVTFAVTRTAAQEADGMLRVAITKTHPDAVQRADETLVLHWAASGEDRRTFVAPPPSMVPAGSERPDAVAVRTPFSPGKENPSHCVAELVVDEALAPDAILFVVFVQPGHGCHEQWIKPTDGAGSFYVPLAELVSEKGRARREEALRAEKEEQERLEREAREAEAQAAQERERKLAEERAKREENLANCRKYIDSIANESVVTEKVELSFPDLGDMVLCAIRDKKTPKETYTETCASVVIATNILLGGDELVLHWGLKLPRKSAWVEPIEDSWPENTRAMGDGKGAVQSSFTVVSEGVRALLIKPPQPEAQALLAVLHIPKTNAWLKEPTSHRDITLELRDTPPLPGLDTDAVGKDAARLVEEVVDKEMNSNSWTLMHRYGHAGHVTNTMCKNDTFCWCAVYVWLRYSQLGVLTWQRNYNTKPREISHSQMSFVTNLAGKYIELPDQRWNIRMSMSCVGRGGSGDLGQKIRDDILVICRHGNWGHGSMMEDWHQKLHNNTNPDDVHICNALLAFWASNGSHSEYWRVLHENGVTRERLASYEQPVRAEPDFQGHIKDLMLSELGRYGHILTQVHLGTDLDTSANHCRGFMHGDTREAVDGYLHARWNAGSLVDKLRAATHARGCILSQIGHEGTNAEHVRDLLFLELAIDSDARRKVEGGEGAHDSSLWTHMASMQTAAEALALSENSSTFETATQLRNIARDLGEVLKQLEYYGESEDVGLRAAAAMNMARNTMTSVVDRFKTYMGGVCVAMGSGFEAPPHTVQIFLEEAIRGSSAYTLSVLLRKADPSVRRIARLGPWMVIAPRSKGVSAGPVRVYGHLRECMADSFAKNTIVVADQCDGDEDVPRNAAFVIIGSTVDILSHVAVRARNEHHGLIACMDADEMERVRSLEGSTVACKLDGENLTIDVVAESALARSRSREMSQGNLRRLKSKNLITPPSGVQGAPLRSFNSMGSFGSMGDLRTSQSSSFQALPPMKRTGSILEDVHLKAPWAIRPSEYTLELVGSKSMNLAKIQFLGLPEWIHVPTCVTIPNGALKKVFRDERNKLLRDEYSRLRTEIYAAKPTDVSLCPELKALIMRLEMPTGLADSLRGVLDELECDDIDDMLQPAWEAVKGVWASTWNERAHLARRKMNMFTEDVDMAVLCQKIVDADYAFVIHTNNPITGAKDEIYGELVVGLGETLVSNAPGQALGFVVNKSELDKPSIKSYPSKLCALKGGLFIFRSDSNSEDLEGFAGAGLHDSIPMEPNHKIEIDYSKEPLMLDEKLRQELMVGIAKIGATIEELYEGHPQDIEGCYKDGKFYVVQSRPQM
ncbi:Alpha-glucan water dikinase, chloroplastic [Porphyridium purpureum]|uniref:Alpha-glucan water dikinase, chloroplastic n=1 Tax=Porphyridium purpureum TaxID=35688 RepID=A0A5J4YPP7_PORPP|nr:Alpha-glucan water dikinase, chloroplastic [Porphyridium purpureum]|eukprot:POR4248..scf295_9